MYTLLKPLSIRQELVRRGVTIFTPLDFQRIFHTSRSRTKYFLEKHTRGGLW